MSSTFGQRGRGAHLCLSGGTRFAGERAPQHGFMQPQAPVGCESIDSMLRVSSPHPPTKPTPRWQACRRQARDLRRSWVFHSWLWRSRGARAVVGSCGGTEEGGCRRSSRSVRWSRGARARGRPVRRLWRTSMSRGAAALWVGGGGAYAAEGLRLRQACEYERPAEKGRQQQGFCRHEGGNNC
jgi:hypothetical protein